ncbi:gamma-glutamyltransferase family protein [Sabulicella rubraurantiaca]|uniref:gamma-glutamyltransferase family protein n=1 Tax=Sabulicella rubraurantiaca TaxID=2811429 RepID=UPI001A9563CF|nr:gamma-glutamyltransferase [Sabulicella rubraurantiaca]
MRPTLYGSRHAASAGHHLAAAAALTVLEGGGNAVDAGVAAGIVLGVVVPDLVNVAGVAPIMIRLADGRVETIAGLGRWPAATPPDVFMREHGGAIPHGVRRTVVPAAPDAWITALERHGTIRFEEAASFAIRWAEEGFATPAILRQTVQGHRDEYARWPSNAAIFLPGGEPPRLGSRFVQTDLARTLRFLADEASRHTDRLRGLAAARDAFYRGDIAQAITRFVQEEGGWLSMEDMAAHRAPVLPAVRRSWRGHEVLACGPWCQGPALIEAMMVAEAAGLAEHAHNSADYLHIVAESVKAALADREMHFGDPDFVEVPLERLLSREHAAARAREIRMDRAHPSLPGEVEPSPVAKEAPKLEADTSYVAVVDRWGNAFSATPSDGSWDSPVVPGLGLIPSNRGCQSRPDPRHKSGVAPGKRPRLTPNPAMIATAEGGIMPFGTPGGDVQIQAMMQVAYNVFAFGMELQEAIEAPRVASYAAPSSFAPFEAHPGLLAAEARIPRAVRDELAARGHRMQEWPETSWLAGCVEAVLSLPGDGLVAAGADIRRPAGCVAA